jgi:hypothetical protein
MLHLNRMEATCHPCNFEEKSWARRARSSTDGTKKPTNEAQQPVPAFPPALRIDATTVSPKATKLAEQLVGQAPPSHHVLERHVRHVKVPAWY